jgi:uncharacterized protein
MLSSMMMSALLMGLVGGPHCVAMCGAACAGISRAAGPGRQGSAALWRFQFSRLLGYSLLGALAGGTIEGMAWMGQYTSVLRPVWIMLHVAALLLGLLLLWQGRQPGLVDGWGQAVWRRIRPALARLGPRAPVVLGMGWALMPCGLLYSALLVASLSASALNGALLMAAFAIGTMVSLLLGPWLLLRLNSSGSGAWGIRLAGLALAGTSGWALWMGITQPTGLWCA